jgi:4,4'-diaponeurosporenoate glycosyltransferase
MLWFNGVLMMAGLIASILVFYRFPRLPAESRDRTASVTVIIPARNEEKTLPLLLADLQTQTIPPSEIIVVDDGSTDDTAAVANRFGVTLLSVKNKPEGWLGKSYACHVGSLAATGEWLLFLDADVRLKPHALASMIAQKGDGKQVLSILPYHETQRPFEQLSLFFNLIQPGAIGLTAAGSPEPSGLFGPAIFLSMDLYRSVGGHESIRNYLIDDLAMGLRLSRLGVPIRLFLGQGTLSYRMYPAGFRSLAQGWIKNFVAAAAKSRFFLFAGIFGFIVSCATPILYGSIAGANHEWVALGIYLVWYGIWVIELFRVSRKLGNFRWWSIVFYPIPLLFFLSVFAISLFRRLFRLPVIWKNRKIDQGGFQ